MKRFLPLLILPLLIWIACDDTDNDTNDNSDYSFVNEWVECKQLSITTNHVDGSQYGATIVWDGNSSMGYDNEGTLTETSTYNEYGFQLLHTAVSLGWVWNYTIIDKWKLSETVTVDENGDTLGFCTYTWDGLTQYQDCHEANHHNFVATHNEYGMPLEFYVINSNSGESYNHQFWTYEDDGRREKSSTINEFGVTHLIRETTWDGNKYETIYYNYNSTESGIIFAKVVGEINEYYKDVMRDFYSYENGNWNLNTNDVFEYECPGFEQIYP